MRAQEKRVRTMLANKTHAECASTQACAHNAANKRNVRKHAEHRKYWRKKREEVKENRPQERMGSKNHTSR